MRFFIKRIFDFFKYDIKYGIRNLIRWFPIIWSDRNWDHYFIFKILKHKLKYTEKCIRNGHHIGCEKSADKIKICILLLDRLINDKYFDIAFKYHTKKWGEANFSFKELEKDDPAYKKGYSSLEITRSNVKTKDDERIEGKEFKFCSNNADQLENQDIDMLFEILRKNIRYWWD